MSVIFVRWTKTRLRNSMASTYGTDGYKSKFFKVGGETYYQDINLQMEKKLTKAFKLNLMYMNQRYNKDVVEGHGGTIKSNIAVAEGKYQFNKKLTLRAEAQYLATKQDEGDWTYGLLELSVLPYFMFTVSDMWNNGANEPSLLYGFCDIQLQSTPFDGRLRAYAGGLQLFRRGLPLCAGKPWFPGILQL